MPYYRDEEDCPICGGIRQHHSDCLFLAAPPAAPCASCGGTRWVYEEQARPGQPHEHPCPSCAAPVAPPEAPDALPVEVRRVVEAAERWQYYTIRNPGASPAEVQRRDAERELDAAVVAWLVAEGKRP